MSRPLEATNGRVEILVEPETKTAWMQAAASEDLTLTQWIRRTLAAELKRAKRRARDEDG